MANTKTHPGMFRCYEAALPDEPMFVILGRDPAGPATLEFWAQERVRQQKVHERDDQDRIKAAIDEAKDMQDWRSRMLAHAEECGLPPVWKLPRPEEHPEDRPVRMAPELGMPYGLPLTDLAIDPTFRETVAIGLRQVTTDMLAEAKSLTDDPSDVLERFVDRINGYAAQLEASRVNPYETFAAALRREQNKPVSHLWSPGPDEDEIRVTPLSFTRMSELLDYATGYGEFDETTPSGTEASEPNVAGNPMNDMRRATIWTLKRCMGIVPENQMPPPADDAPKTPVAEVIVQGVVRVGGQDYSIEHLERILAGQSLPKGLHNPKDKERIAELEGEIAALKITKDSEPEDLAHAPEVPHHRFSVFHTSGDYAYARGLEVNPMHLPTALDAMAKSGWHLCAIFGQTDAQHIGFIFRREVERFSAFEIAHGYGSGFADTRPRDDESEEFKRFKAGEPLDKIRDIRFTVQGLDPETTHYRNAEWTGDPEKLIKALGDAKPEVRETFLRQEQVSSLAHYWRVASVGSLIRLIRLLDWQDRINLLSPISPEMVAKVLNCGGEGQEPCPDWGRGLAI